MTNHLKALYCPSLSLHNDLYQLTMAYAHWKAGSERLEAVFQLYYRQNPFGSGYAIACGLQRAIEYVENFRFEEDDLQYLATLKGADGEPLFESAFFDYLQKLPFTCDIDAVPEGTVVFPQEPLVRVRGPIVQGQLLESPLLNIINFETLIATKASRVCSAAEGEPVLEFGMRRAQGVDGALSASRAAYVGGCAATSNVMAGKIYGIPVRGTHAHSWVMAYDDELTSFQAYAEAMPHNCVFLVDTYDTLQGVRHAVQVGKWLRQHGHEMLGVRLDSGDLADLSIRTREILDEGGFPNASILASNDLDEHVIASLKQQDARVNVWGVGTKLATGFDQPALGGVYKLSAIRRPGEDWEPRLKKSEQLVKTSNPGMLQVRRFERDDQYLADAIYDELLGCAEKVTVIDPFDETRRRVIPAGTASKDLLAPIYRGGKRVYHPPPLDEVRQMAQAELARLHPGIKRFLNPHEYPVGLESQLYERKQQLLLQARGVTTS